MATIATDIEGLTDGIETLTVETETPTIEAEEETKVVTDDSPIRAIMLETVDMMIKEKFKQHGIKPDSEDLNQVFIHIYKACCPDNVCVEPKNLLYEESIVKDVLNRIQF